MEMIRKCLDITEAKRAELDAFDRRTAERNALDDDIMETFGNRKQRRRQAALERQGKA